MTRTHLIVPGQPVPKARAKKGKHGRWYTPQPTLDYAETVRKAWMVEGRPYLGEGWITLRARFYFEHSVSNLKKDGEPRKSAPMFPDADFDNLLKAVTDPLSGFLFRDDRQVGSGAWWVGFVENGDEARAELDFAAYGDED